MKVQLWCDMEGVAGIVAWDQVNAGKAGYEEGRRLYTDETNACIRGCRAGGATTVVAIDGHGAGGGYTFNSWNKDRLEPGAEYVFGYRWGCYVEELANGCDALLLPGAHAMAGTRDGVLCHTISSTNWVRASIKLADGRWVEVGESGLVAAIAGGFGVPVIFASGDTSTCREVRDLVGPGLVEAEVKRGLGRYSARTMAPQDACKLIEARSREAVASRAAWPAPLKTSSPAQLKVELHTADQALPYAARRGVENPEPRTLTSTAPTFWECWDQFWHPR